MKYKQQFYVYGTCFFPLDMLRYDECFPADELGSAKLAAAVLPGTGPWRIKLTRYVETKGRLPTVDRWESFQAHVDETSLVTYKI